METKSLVKRSCKYIPITLALALSTITYFAGFSSGVQKGRDEMKEAAAYRLINISAENEVQETRDALFDEAEMIFDQDPNKYISENSSFSPKAIREYWKK